MPIDLTSVYEKVSNIHRNLLYPEGTTMKFFELDRVILELEDGFKISTRPTTNLALGAEYFEATIAVTDELIREKVDETIPKASKVVVGKDQYTIAQYFQPRAETHVWKLRLESSGTYKSSR